MKHYFTVAVSGCSKEQAEQVVAERIDYDEDYGFDYIVEIVDPVSPLGICERIKALDDERVMLEHRLLLTVGKSYEDFIDGMRRLLERLPEPADPDQ